MTLSPYAQTLLTAIQAGHLVAYPTDGLPGLGFDPLQDLPIDRMRQIKGRQAQKPFLGLVGSLAMAKHFWKPLPKAWQTALANLWPGPLTVVWNASKEAPSAITSTSGKIALRFPDLADEQTWLYDVIAALGHPLPSTSINERGEEPLTDWPAIEAFAKPYEIVLVRDKGRENQMPRLPSTIIEITDESYNLIRLGALSIHKIDLALGKAGS